MTTPTNPETNTNSKTTNTLILVIGIIIIGLLAFIAFYLISNSANTPDAGGGEPPQIELPEHLPSGPTVTAIEAINIRSGPSTDYPSYGVTAPGQAAQVIGTSPDGRWRVIVIAAGRGARPSVSARSSIALVFDRI